MPENVTREDVQRLVAEGGQLVEVLPREAYEDLHLAGAISIPLGELSERAPRELDPATPVITYCHDFLWDLSARAAWRLETLGFRHVYRYQPGKDDWLVARLPMGGRRAGARTAAGAARADVPTCGLRDRVAEVAEQVRAGGWPLAVVVSDRRVVLGRLRRRDLDDHPDAVAEDIMRDGPRTIRGARPASEMARWLEERGVNGVLVTTADGELIGYLRRDELWARPFRRSL